MNWSLLSRSSLDLLTGLLFFFMSSTDLVGSLTFPVEYGLRLLVAVLLFLVRPVLLLRLRLALKR